MYLVTGGGSGIGKALALHLANQDKEVLIVGRRENLLKETAGLSKNIRYVCADVGQVSGREKIVAFVGNQKIEALVNNAATLGVLKPFMEVSISEWQTLMATNVEAPLFLTQLLKHSLSGGKVLNVGSGAAHRPLSSVGPYCVSKAALYMLTQVCSLENGDIAFAWATPGISDTSMQTDFRENKNLPNQHFYQEMKQRELLISPETVAAFFAWLLLEVPQKEYVAGEWDIYDTKHHDHWLKPPYSVPIWS